MYLSHSTAICCIQQLVVKSTSCVHLGIRYSKKSYLLQQKYLQCMTFVELLWWKSVKFNSHVPFKCTLQKNSNLIVAKLKQLYEFKELNCKTFKNQNIQGFPTPFYDSQLVGKTNPNCKSKKLNTKAHLKS